YNENNFYLYYDPEIGRFRYIPYDLDNTWGIDFIGRDWGTRNVYDWPKGPTTGEPPRPLAKRLLQVEDYRDRFSFYLGRLLNEAYTTGEQFPRVEALRALIEDAAVADPYRPLDYGWSAGDFRSSFDQALGGHVAYGLKPFIATRRSSALAQTETVDIAPLISDLRVEESVLLPGAPLTVRAWIEDEGVPASVRLYASAGATWTAVEMTASGDGVYTATMGPFASGETVRYYVEAEDASGQTRTEPRSGANAPATATILTPGGPSGLFVNEVMASNDATVADEFGEFDDWAEIYNGSDASVSLGGLYFTDDLAEPDKFALPDTVVAPGAFVLLWVDDDEEQGPMHAPFNLSASGESAALFQPDDSGGFTLVSGITFGPQETDISYGRIGDGGERWSRFGDPTPEASNATSTASETVAANEGLAIVSVAPNPFRDDLAVTVRVPRPSRVTLDLLDALGRRIATLSRSSEAGVVRLAWTGRLPAGPYLVRIRAEDASGAVSTASRAVTAIR
ncbi:MAG: CotH kinase family protein, partial [Bacteroidota bacterium]